MSNKRNISTILGIAGATVLAAGGSAFVTNTGMSLLDTNKATVQESEVAINDKETEQPLKVETFTATKDSFTIKPDSSDSGKDKATQKESEKDTANGDTSNNSAAGDNSSDGNTSDGNTSSNKTSGGGNGGTSSTKGYYDDNGNYYDGSGGYYDTNGLYHDEWGGYYAANGDYYDGQGGYYDGDGYHKVNSSSGNSSSGNSSSGNSSSGNQGAWDDSYILYDVNSRYLSASDLSGWSADELAILRNEIFARHGRIFKTQKWRDYFSTKTWYEPKYENVDNLLNDYEWKNLDVIMKLEEQLG